MFWGRCSGEVLRGALGGYLRGGFTLEIVLRASPRYPPGSTPPEHTLKVPQSNHPEHP